MKDRVSKPSTIALLVPLLLAAAVSASAQPAVLQVASSSGRSYQMSETGRWAAIYAGRHLAEGRRIMTAAGASIEIAVGTLHLRVEPLSVFSLAISEGAEGRIDLAIKAVAGSFRIEQPAGDSGVCTIEAPFGSVRASGAEFLLDGNRLQVSRGVVRATNDRGSTRTVFRGESLTIFPDLPLDRPSSR